MYIARQPIFTNSLEVYAYELLYRQSGDSITFDGTSSKKATAGVVSGLFELGFEQIVDNTRAFINFDADFLKEDLSSLIDPQKLVIEVLEDTIIDEALIEKIKALKAEGYKIALDDFVESYDDYPLVPYADIIKFDLMLTPLSTLGPAVNKALLHNKILLAEKNRNGRGVFEGKGKWDFIFSKDFFFSKPRIIGKSSGSKNSSKIQYARILNELKKEEPSYQILAEIIEEDANLAYRLMKVISSRSGDDLIYSIKRALTYMGLKEIERWISILMIQDLGENKPKELIMTSLIRSKFAEAIAQNSVLKKSKHEASMMGLFSVIDAMLDSSMTDALSGLSLPQSIKTALIDGDGVLMPILELVKAYEKGDWERADNICKLQKLDAEELMAAYVDAVKWTGGYYQVNDLTLINELKHRLNEFGGKMKLDKVRDNAQMICEAIASVMDIDVTIVDEALLRIAGTGRYEASIGLNVGDHSAFSYALKTKVGFVIENPGEHQACKMCECKNKCNEHAEVCCPINLNGETIGVIGLIAFESRQKQHIIKNQSNLLKFLNRMADLISSKVNEQAALENMALLAKELEIVVDALDTGFIAVNCDGSVIRANPKLLKMTEKNEICCLVDFFGEAESAYILSLKEPMSNRSYASGAWLYDVSLIQIDSEIRGYVITLRAIEEVINTVNEVLLDPVTTRFDHIIGHSEILNQAKTLALKVASGTSTVLILGESGTGKELFSRAIHQSSPRCDQPFIAINCAAIPEQLLESELFGYEEGAFTGAKKGGKPGKFQLANKGTLLDEIGDMPLHLQAKLLRVLQEGRIERIGGKDAIDIDVRIIAATNQDLDQKVEEGAFRKDLYYRLSVIPINVPSLRQRKEDIPELVWHLVKRAGKKLSKSIGSIEDTCFERLRQYDWPGNVRELENTIEYAVNMCDTNTLRMNCLPKRLQGGTGSVSDELSAEVSVDIVLPIVVSDEPKDDSSVLKYEEQAVEIYEPRTLALLEREAIQNALEYYKPYKKSYELVAKSLGISRATLYRKMTEYKLDKDK